MPTNGPVGDDPGRLLRQQRVVAELGELALSTASAGEVLQRASDLIATAAQVELVGIFEPSPGGDLILRAGRGWAPHLRPATLPPAVAAELVAAGGARPLSGLAALAEARLVRAHDLRSGIAASMRSSSAGPGLLLAGTRQERAFEPVDEEFLATVATLVSGALEHRRMEDALRASERRLAEAQELAHVGSYDWNILTDENVWSDELYRIYGCEPQSFNASYDRFLSFVHPDDREKLIEVHKRAYETHEPYQTEERIIRPDGEERVLATTGEVTVDDDGNPVRMRGICIDITEQRRAEDLRRRLRQTDELRRQALEINDNIVQGLTSALWALEHGALELGATAVQNTLAAAREMIHELLHRSGAALAPGDLVREHAAPSVFGPVAEQFEEERVAGPSEGLRVVIADDADDVRLMLRLALSTAGCRIVGEAVNGDECVIAVEELQPEVIILDLAMPELDGVHAIPLIRAACPATKIVVLSGFGAEEVEASVLSAGADAFVPKVAGRSALIGALERVCPGKMAVSPALPLDPDHPEGAGSDHGLVEHLVHELRNPTSVLVGLASTLRQQIDSIPSSAAQQILEGLERNALLVDDLLGAVSDARRVGGSSLHIRPERVDVAGLVRGTVADLQRTTASHNLVVRGPDVLTAEVDALRVRQVLTNLLDNARRYVPSGSPIEVDVAEEGDTVVVSVADRGPGIPADRRSELFRRFSRLGASGRGMGLGLFISRGVAEAHGGTLDLDQTYAPGARFVLRLPKTAVNAERMP